MVSFPKRLGVYCNLLRLAWHGTYEIIIWVHQLYRISRILIRTCLPRAACLRYLHLPINVSAAQIKKHNNSNVYVQPSNTWKRNRSWLLLARASRRVTVAAAAIETMKPLFVPQCKLYKPIFRFFHLLKIRLFNNLRFFLRWDQQTEGSKNKFSEHLHLDNFL